MAELDTADLRRLAEHRMPNNHRESRVNYRDGKAILALLDRLARAESRLRDLEDDPALDRVAALKEGLRPAIVAAYCRVRHGYIHGAECDSYNGQLIADEVARALLAAAPGGVLVPDAAIRKDADESGISGQSTPGEVPTSGDPAALPAEVGPPDDLGVPGGEFIVRRITSTGGER